MKEQAKHTAIGKRLGLFYFHNDSPGAPFFLPHGVRVIERLKTALRSLYDEYGYQEVMTPLVFSQGLWETSGHWTHYQEDMFKVSGFVDREQDSISVSQVLAAESHLPADRNDEDESGAGNRDKGGSQQSSKGSAPMKGLKPMNCPAHCLIFKSTTRSYRDLPLRLSEFSALHRNEASGALQGLTRVRQFHQDDAHIFCTLDQIETEVAQCLSFLDRVYEKSGLTYSLALATRPNESVGAKEEWDRAESQLRKCLDSLSIPYTTKPEDGAFYGPKIDIALEDVHGRQQQTATIQLDFQLPQRFGLAYETGQASTAQQQPGSSQGLDRSPSDDAGTHARTARPIIIHRAVLGSLERMLALLLETTHGRLPLWCSPRQVAIIPTSADFAEHATSLAKEFTRSGIFADVLAASSTVSKRKRESVMLRYNLAIVVGAEEVKTGQYRVAFRDQPQYMEGLPPKVQALLEADKTAVGKGLQTPDAIMHKIKQQMSFLE